jgi:glycosyltransferase involved in cell wall biosynthesis
VFTGGDSSKPSTWSNIPYFFTETLISKGIKVNRVDLSPCPWLNAIYQVALILYKIAYVDTTYTYDRSLVHFLDTRRRIRKAIQKYGTSQANIFLTFSFSSAGLTQKPAIQVCDWTYDHYINYYKERKPDILEKWSMKREDSQIEGSDLVIPLFPTVASYMRERYRNRNIFYLGNVINSLSTITESRAVEQKTRSNDLLFIGDKKYVAGARSLVKAFIVLKKEYPDLSLNIIGIQAGGLGNLPDGVKCHGYLDKGRQENRELYYALLERAKIYVNTTPKWGAFSAMLEAMYFYTPVIVTPYDEFVETFGAEIGFGAYCENNSLDLLCTKITQIMEDRSYGALCANAHAAVKDFTWDIYIDKMLALMKENLREDAQAG